MIKKLRNIQLNIEDLLELVWDMPDEEILATREELKTIFRNNREVTIFELQDQRTESNYIIPWNIAVSVFNRVAFDKRLVNDGQRRYRKRRFHNVGWPHPRFLP